MSLDTRKIEYFLAVVQHRNISSAAEALRVSQPTLSRQIHALEEEFSTALFLRHGRGVIPTEAGKRLHEGLRRVEHQLRNLRDEVFAAANEPTGEVSLGLPPSPRTLLAVSLIKTFLERCPQVAIRVTEQTSGDIRDGLAAGEIDLAIINSDEPLEGLASHGLASEPMMLVGPPDAKLSLATATKISRLAELPLILTTHPNSLRRMVELRLHAEGLRPNVRVQANTLPLMTNLVAQGLGFTVLPSCSVVHLVEAGQLSASPLTGLNITWLVARPLNRALTVAARRLLETLFQTVRQLVETGVWRLARLEPDCRAATKAIRNTPAA